MTEYTKQTFWALHPHWTGNVVLDFHNQIAELEGRNSRGPFRLSGDQLFINWEKFKPDLFILISGQYVHESMVSGAPDLRKLSVVSLGGKKFGCTNIGIQIPNQNHHVSLRLFSSDISTFEQIFVVEEYNSPNLPESAMNIMDLGANIGLASVFFMFKYPGSTICAVEPEEVNVQIAALNLSIFGARAHLEHAAVWHEDSVLRVRTADERGRPLGAWGARVSAESQQDKKAVAAYSMATLLRRCRFENVDILKIDIEGAELELFSGGSLDWLRCVNFIIVETHDRFRPGSDQAVRNALSGEFEELPRKGENLFFRRISV
jgi:FkbM family methyltransferase